MSRVCLPWILWTAAASCSAQTLVVDVYDYSNLSAKEIVSLTGIAELVYAHSGICIVWRQCRGAAAAAIGNTCEHEIQVNEIVVRLEARGPHSSDADWATHLGLAEVTPEGGHYASVYVPAVRARAAEFGIAFEILMGYAVAHEVGHCLLGYGHSWAGLMRSVWDRNDASEMSRVGVHLTRQEARKAVDRLARAESAVHR